MKYRVLGKGGFNVSEVGLGCWQLGADWGKDFNQADAERILSSAVERGVTFFDTADVYGDGKSESFIGDFLQQVEPLIRVATKYGRAGGIYPDQYSEDGLRKAVDASRKRLKVDRIDLLQLHCVPSSLLKEQHIFDWLRKLQADGAISSFGASVETIEEGMFCLQQEGMQSLQVICNVMRQRPTQQLFRRAHKQGVGIIVRLPLNSGLLSGKMTTDTAFAKTDHRNYNRDGEAFNIGETFGGLVFNQGVEIADKLKSSYLPQELTLPNFALRWLLDHPAVSSVIPGASKIEHVISNTAASDLTPLSTETHRQLQDFYTLEIDEKIRGPY